MNAGLIPLAIGMVGAAYAILVFGAARRRDNLIFGLLTCIDAAMTAWRGINVLSGASIISRGVLVPCTIGTVLLSLLTFEFIWSFPGRAPMAWKWRIPMLAWGVLALTLAGIEASTPWNGMMLSELLFFAPATVIVFVIGIRSFRLTQRRDARIVIAVLWFRWGFGFIVYFVGPLTGDFASWVWAETTFATLISFVVIGTQVLRTELFSIRSSAAEVVTIATIALIVKLGGGGAVLAALEYLPPGRLQILGLFGATLVPLVLAATGYALYPRVERRVLAGLDERRARRLGVQGEPLPADAESAIAEATRRISSIGDGASVRWMPAGLLSPGLVDSLHDGAPRRKDQQPDLPAAFVVPALGADRAVVGAFLIDDGLVDRDTYVVARDLAARIALSVELDHAVSQLEDARRLAALGQFAAAIAHDIRTPLTSISLNVQILRRKLQLSDDDREHLDIALEELARLDRSVAEILDFAKPVKLASETIDIGELLDNAARGMSPVLFEKGVAVRHEPNPEPHAVLTVTGDSQRLRQVLVNLVDNAADASARGTEVTLRASATDDRRVAIEVEDHGRGIGAEDLPRIFDPFFTTRPDGTGLGLAICHKVVRAHGGDIRVRSAPGIGSTFTIVLPAAAT